MLKLSRNGIKANFQTQGLPIKNNKLTALVNKGYRLSQLGNSAHWNRDQCVRTPFDLKWEHWTVNTKICMLSWHNTTIFASKGTGSRIWTLNGRNRDPNSFLLLKCMVDMWFWGIQVCAVKATIHYMYHWRLCLNNIYNNTSLCYCTNSRWTELTMHEIEEQ